MSEFVLELSLSRSSGVLASIVASLGQAGLHLQSQKLDRSGSGWLTIHAEGDSPGSEALADRLNSTRGVDRLMRLSIDGETVIRDGDPVVQTPAAAETGDETIRAEDLAQLSAGSASGESFDPGPDDDVFGGEAELGSGSDAAEDTPPIETADAGLDVVPEPADEPEPLSGDESEESATVSASEEKSSTEEESTGNAEASVGSLNVRAVGEEERMKENMRRRRRRRR